MNLKNKNVIITGAGSGLGKKLAELISAKAKLMVAIDRNQERLDEIKNSLKGHVEIVQTDLADKKSFSELLTKFEKQKRKYDLLINCAGVGSHKKIKDLNYEEIQSLVAVNSVAPIVLTSYLIKNSLLNKNSKVVNIGSISGDMPLPNISLYGSSKSALHYFTRAASIELKKDGINFLLVILGSLRDTDFGKDLKSEISGKFKFYDRFKTTANQASVAIINAIEENSEELVYPWYLKLALSVERHLPGVTKTIKLTFFNRFF